jgi:hypothetical protein
VKLPVTVKTPEGVRVAWLKLGGFCGLVPDCGLANVPTLIPGNEAAKFPAMALAKMRIPPPVMLIPCWLPMMILAPPVVLSPI